MNSVDVGAAVGGPADGLGGRGLGFPAVMGGALSTEADGAGLDADGVGGGADGSIRGSIAEGVSVASAVGTGDASGTAAVGSPDREPDDGAVMSP